MPTPKPKPTKAPVKPGKPTVFAKPQPRRPIASAAKPMPKGSVATAAKKRASAKPTKAPAKSNPYMDSISKMQAKQDKALKDMWAKDKKRKTAQIRTK